MRRRGGERGREAGSPKDDISPLGVGRNGRRDCGKSVGVDYGFFATCELCKSLLQLQMDICTIQRWLLAAKTIYNFDENSKLLIY